MAWAQGSRAVRAKSPLPGAVARAAILPVTAQRLYRRSQRAARRAPARGPKIDRPQNLRAPPVRNLDFSSWSAMMTTLMGLVLVSVVAVGIRLVFMQTI